MTQGKKALPEYENIAKSAVMDAQPPAVPPPANESQPGAGISPIIAFIQTEWRVMKTWAFWIAVLLVGIGLVTIVNWHFSGVLMEKDATIARLQALRGGISSNTSPQTFHVESGAAVSVGQSGGITAGTIIITNSGKSNPLTMPIKIESENQPDGGQFITKVLFTLPPGSSVPNIRLAVRGQFIQGVTLEPMDMGYAQATYFAAENGWQGVTVVAPFGKLRLNIRTSHPDHFDFGYNVP